MTTLQRLFVLTAVPVALWNTNCVDTSGFQLQHPLIAGGVQQNSEHSQEYQRERINGIQPGSLTSDGSLVAMNEQETCFQVVLRTTGDRADLAEPRNWRVFLRGEPKFEDMGPVFKDSAPQTQQPGRSMEPAPATLYVHESRLIVFDGQPVSRRAQRESKGWGESVFTRVEEVLSQYKQTWGAVANLMQDFAQGVLKVKVINAAGINSTTNGWGLPRQIMTARCGEQMETPGREAPGNGGHPSSVSAPAPVEHSDDRAQPK